MNEKEVFTKIGGIIKELNDQYAYLQAEPANLNSLELELFVSNARFLTNHIEILAKLNSHISYNQPVPEPKQEPKHVEPAAEQNKPEMPEKEAEQTKPEVPEKETEQVKPALPEQPIPDIDLGEAGSSDSYSYIRQEPETIRHELVLDESVNWEDNDEDLEEENKPPKISHDKPLSSATARTDKESEPAAEKSDPVKEKAKPAAPEKSQDDVVTINQKMSSQLAGKAGTGPVADAPISDIKQAITLNDKLLFIKDLFNGYSLAYSEAVEIINRFNTFEEATTFLNKNYAIKNNWESKPETVEKFYGFVRRRYA